MGPQDDDSRLRRGPLQHGFGARILRQDSRLRANDSRQDGYCGGGEVPHRRLMPANSVGFHEIRLDRGPTDWRRRVLVRQLRYLYGFRVKNRTRHASRITSALVLLAVAVRILLPGLHTHSHGTPPTGAEFAAAVGTPCSCGVEHLATDGQSTGDTDAPRLERSLELFGPHHCLACEIQLGKPCGCPPVPASLADQTLTRQASAPCPCALEVVHAVGLPRPRAPPGDEV